MSSSGHGKYSQAYIPPGEVSELQGQRGNSEKNPERKRRMIAPIKIHLNLIIKCLFLMCLIAHSSIPGGFPSHSNSGNQAPSTQWLCQLLPRRGKERMWTHHSRFIKASAPKRNGSFPLLIPGLK